jgi:hypothetical protein
MDPKRKFIINRQPHEETKNQNPILSKLACKKKKKQNKTNKIETNPVQKNEKGI